MTEKVHRSLQADVAVCSAEVHGLRAALLEKEQELRELKKKLQASRSPVLLNTPKVNSLSNGDIMRYSRQLILPGVGVSGQMKLKASSILIVGLGGLGCPAVQYLAAAGCGHLGLVDYDEVERNNLQRQILYNENSIGNTKAESAAKAVKLINSSCKVDTYYTLLDSHNAPSILEPYDVVLDCTDNVVTRYLLNDACIIMGKPLVSGSALQMDGQVTVYNYGEDCPCYRCLYPVPPPKEAITNCDDGGVLGAVTGVIGSMQAIEAIKIVTGVGDVLAGRLLIYDGAQARIRNIKLRGRRPTCDICSETPMITHLIDYEQFCGSRAHDKNEHLRIIPLEQRITTEDYLKMRTQEHLLIDVRQPAEYEICRLPNSINVPLKEILDNSYEKRLAAELCDKNLPKVLLCRRGNDSQIAVQHIANKFPDHSIRDIVGGLYSWQRDIDNDFPIY